MRLDEFSLIERIAARTAARADIVLGIGDDCALLAPPAGQVLAVTADTLNAGVHFPLETPAFDIGWKTLAVNLSDLAAMGARPAWCTLALSLPDSDPVWLEAFADGLFALADAAGITLVGGDTTRGPLSLSVTAMGWVPAALALALWQQGRLDVAAAQADPLLETLRQRLLRPSPRNALGLALRGIASAAIDVSDGLGADLGHVCQRSGLAAQLQLAALPVSPALARFAAGEQAWPLQTGGGDDYELCFSAPAAAHDRVLAAAASAGVAVHCIGRLQAGQGVHWQDPAGRPWLPPR